MSRSSAAASSGTAEVMRRVVQVWVPDDPADRAAEPRTDGTGYLVAPRAVLTARHVVEAALTEWPSDSSVAVHRLKVCPLGERGERQQSWLARSEEHTSELQSRRDLVCRLLL